MNNLAEKRRGINMQFTEIKKQIEFMMQENYEDFIKALISIDLGVDNDEKLASLYNRYMESDDFWLLNEMFYK